MSDQNQQLSPKQKEEFKKVCFYVYKRQDSQIRIIAAEEDAEFATVIRGMLDECIVKYLQEKSTVKESGYCQNRECDNQGKLIPKRKLHQVLLGFEKFLFCDPCFYNGSYRGYIRQMI